MGVEFREVKEQDFMTFGGEKPSHLLIEEALIGMGGTQLKKDALQMAGWNGSRLTTYASRAELAAQAFNKIRTALKTADTAEELKAKLNTD